MKGCCQHRGASKNKEKGVVKGQFYTIIAILVIIPAMILVTQYVSSERRGGEIYERVVADQAHQVEASV